MGAAIAESDSITFGRFIKFTFDHKSLLPPVYSAELHPYASRFVSVNQTNTPDAQLIYAPI